MGKQCHEFVFLSSIIAMIFGSVLQFGSVLLALNQKLIDLTVLMSC